MPKLELNLACWDYDRTRPLVDGRVRPDGVDLAIQVLRPHEIFDRMLHNKAFDCSELSLASLAGLVGRGDCPFVGLPAPLSRFFRHSCVYVRADAGIKEPKDLVGKRVGVTQYGATAVVFMRGMLQDEYGIAAKDMKWVIGGLTSPVQRPLIALATPGDIDLTFLRDGETLEGLLARGEIDALFSIYIPQLFLDGSPKIARLFPDYRQDEELYWRRTGIFPIMHVVAIRKDVYAKNPWVAQSLYDAFKRARDIALEELYDTDALRVALPWLIRHVEETRAVFGSDYWPLGLEANRATFSALGRYVFEQGLSPRVVRPEEIFLPVE